MPVSLLSNDQRENYGRFAGPPSPHDLAPIAWWDRPVAWITQHLDQIRGGDIDALETAVADGVVD